MNYQYHYAAQGEEGLIAAVIYYLICIVFGGGMGIVAYVFRSLGIYRIAGRRGLKRPWLAWIPVADQYLLGCISDQYQYVVRGRNTNRRRWLLVLQLLSAVLTAVLAGSLLGVVFRVVDAAMRGMNESYIVDRAMASVLGALGLAVPVAGLAAAVAVIRYIALYDLYTSLEPRNKVMYLVLSILFRVTEPFFIFFNRNKDEGMPPRKAAPAEPAPFQETPVWESAPEEAEPWKRPEAE